VSFNFLHQAVQNVLFGPTFWGEPFDVGLLKICKQPHIGPSFTNPQIFILSGLGEVSGTSNWSVEKKEKNKKKLPQWGYVGCKQMKAESLCTARLQTYEKFS